MRDKNKSPALEYISNLFAAETPLLKEIREYLNENDLPIQIGAEEGRLLQVLMQMHNVKNIIEVGTLAAYSTLWMAEYLPDDGHIYTIENSQLRAGVAQKFIKKSDCANKITLIEGDACTILENFDKSKKINMIFIDANKNQYLEYLKHSEEILEPGGLIIADNCLLFDSVFETKRPDNISPTTWENMKLFNQRLADKDHYHSVMIPTEQGMIIAIKK